MAHSTSGLVVGLIAAVSAYAFLFRPWHLRWGATQAEVARILPGDDLVRRPKLSATHAITIAAPASRVWPWLVQIGQGRGGFYSYDWLENLFGCDIHNASHIVSAWQALKPGDAVGLHPKTPPIPVVVVEPERVIVLHADSRTGPPVAGAKMKSGQYMNVAWVFYLESVDAHTTRLIERFRLDWNPSLAITLANRFLLEPASFIMERKMLLGIKQRAER